MRLSEAEAQVEGVVGRGGAVVLEALGYRLPGVLDGPVIPALAQRRRCREGGEVKCADTESEEKHGRERRGEEVACAQLRVLIYGRSVDAMLPRGFA